MYCLGVIGTVADGDEGAYQMVLGDDQVFEDGHKGGNRGLGGFGGRGVKS